MTKESILKIILYPHNGSSQVKIHGQFEMVSKRTFHIKTNVTFNRYGQKNMKSSKSYLSMVNGTMKLKKVKNSIDRKVSFFST